MSEDPVVVGIDVGGATKGFHAVALRGCTILCVLASCKKEEIRSFCERQDTSAIGIDAPRSWRATEERRSAERALSQAGIHCFSTPSPTAGSHDFYSWMRNGHSLYAEIEQVYALYDGQRPVSSRTVFETYPHAIERAFCDKATAKQKRKFRRCLLAGNGITSSKLTNIDFYDAALCALTAQYVLANNHIEYGDTPKEGIILVPRYTGKKALSYWYEAASEDTRRSLSP